MWNFYLFNLFFVVAYFLLSIVDANVFYCTLVTFYCRTPTLYYKFVTIIDIVLYFITVHNSIVIQFITVKSKLNVGIANWYG